MRLSRPLPPIALAALALALAGCPAGLPVLAPAAVPMGGAQLDAGDGGDAVMQVRPSFAERHALAVVPKYTLAQDVHHVTYTLYKNVPAASLASGTAQPPLVTNVVQGPLGTAITDLERSGAAVQDPVTFKHLRRGVTYTFTVVAYKTGRITGYDAISDVKAAYSFTPGSDDAVAFGQLAIALLTPFDGQAAADKIVLTGGGLLPAGLVSTVDSTRDDVLDAPMGLAADGYVADTNRNALYRFTGQSCTCRAGDVKSPAGYANASDGLQAQFNAPQGLVQGTGGLYIADTGNHAIRFYAFEGGGVSTFVGAPASPGGGVADDVDDSGTAARFNRPRAITVAGGGQLYVADAGNHKLRSIDPQGGVTTFATGFMEPCGLAYGGGKLYVADEGDHSLSYFDLDAQDPGVRVPLATCADGPHGLALGDNNRLYFTEDARVRYVDLAAAGTPMADYAGKNSGFQDGFSRAAFRGPTGLFFEFGRLTVCDPGNHVIRTVGGSRVAS
ncbi:MAG: hypothetical protein JWM80_1200 [Cyanobacteria bacterium RYN_339]|nr:hypothetical protein [Cyanobacteria bacterium RYN_339]